MSAVSGAPGMHGRLDTARAHGLAACECCALVSRAAPLGSAALACPRCACALHVRKPRSLQRTTAFLFAAVLLYIPANLLPVMTTVSVFGPYGHTLLGGIAELWLSGSAGLALIVFVASIVVPVLKIAALGMLVWTAGRASRWRVWPDGRWRGTMTLLLVLTHRRRTGERLQHHRRMAAAGAGQNFMGAATELARAKGR